MMHPAYQISKPITIACGPNLAEAAALEVEALGLPVKAVEGLAVQTEGTLADCLRLNLHLRSANRVLYRLAQWHAPDPDALYQEARKFPWHNALLPNEYLSIHSYAKNDHVRDTQFPNRKLKDAIVDVMKQRFGKRPDTGPNRDGAMIYLHWQGADAQVFLDTTGETIAKHGYRVNPWKAPMLESLAAGVLLYAGWPKPVPFVNPMCGSGTLAIEAALMALNRPPDLARKNYAFMHFKDYDRSTWRKLTREARQAAAKEWAPPIIATDKDPRAVDAARRNALEAGVDQLITFHVCPFEETPMPEESGVVMLNPAYGLRLGEEQKLGETYSAIGDFFKQKAQGYMGYVFTGNMNLGKRVGLKPKRRIPLMNGSIDCRLLEFELYGGSRKKTEE